MMTPAMLERGTDAFRRGYRDAYAGKHFTQNPYAANDGGFPVKYTFAAHDWHGGWEAAYAEQCYRAVVEEGIASRIPRQILPPITMEFRA